MSRLRFLALSTAILLIAFALRMISLGDDSLWSDEAFTVFFADAPAGEFVPLLLTDGVHVPLYFALMRALSTGSDLMLRWPSVLLGVGGIALMIRVTLRLYSNRSLALWAGLLLACNPYHVWFSRQARPYALFFVVALLASYYFLTLLSGKRSTARWVGFGLSSAAAYLTHFFAAALPMAQYAVLGFALQGNRRMFRQWLLVQLVALAPLAWWIYRLVTQEVVSFGIAWIPKPILADLPLTLANMGIGTDGLRTMLLLPALIALVVGLIGGIRNAWKVWRYDRADLYWFWLMILTLVPVFLLSQIRPIYVDRYFMVLLPGLLLLVLRGWSVMSRTRWSLAQSSSPATKLPGSRLFNALAAILIISGAAQVLWSVMHEENERQSWHGVSAFVADEYLPGDGFVMEPALSLLPFLRYWEDEALLRANLIPPEDAEAALHNRLWAIVTNPNVNVHREQAGESLDPFAPSDSILSRWLIAQRDHVEAQHEVNGVAALLIVQGTD
ncbi:MAG: glycosyltransferase family 39 protein [Anaerolineae bacterium]|nr:glycosyltransferase family 39 protein [Anaerolineae bacterium]